LLKEHSVRVNFPETFIEVEGELLAVWTDRESGQLQARKIAREAYSSAMNEVLEREMEELATFHCKYKDHYDYRKNAHAPVVVTKTAAEEDANFRVNVESFKVYHERATAPTASTVVQRFIYPRNMQAMVIRVCYCAKGPNKLAAEFYAERFQNVDSIFSLSRESRELYEMMKLHTIISAAYDRENTIEFSRITNMKGLERFVEQSRELIWFLEVSQKVQVGKIYIDFTVDLYNVPWLLNIKKLEYTELSALCKSYKVVGHESLRHCGSYGVCKVCSLQVSKKELQKSISRKMLGEYLSHLRKRLRVGHYERMQFIKDIANSKAPNYSNLKICGPCYELILQEYKLIEQEGKLALLCNIGNRPTEKLEPQRRPLNLPGQLKQWRLMVFVAGLSNLPGEFLPWPYEKGKNPPE
jgi:hypothetical protein